MNCYNTTERPSPEGGLDRKSLYATYQAIVEHFESGDLKVTFGILALTAGIIARSLTKEQVDLLGAIYSTESLMFIVPFFLWGTMYSAWNRYRVLHAVGSLVVLERAIGISKPGYAYWMGNAKRPWLYLLVSPWPWLLLLFAAGSFCGPEPRLGPYLLGAWAFLTGGFVLTFLKPCRAATVLESDRIMFSEEAKDFSIGRDVDRQGAQDG